MARGFALYHALFGFTSAWRGFLTEGRGAGLRAQMVMLALASSLFLRLPASGTGFETSGFGAVSLPDQLGMAPALAIQFAALAAIY